MSLRHMTRQAPFLVTVTALKWGPSDWDPVPPSFSYPLSLAEIIATPHDLRGHQHMGPLKAVSTCPPLWPRLLATAPGVSQLCCRILTTGWPSSPPCPWAPRPGCSLSSGPACSRSLSRLGALSTHQVGVLGPLNRAGSQVPRLHPGISQAD